jgi:hypothetical protein
MKNYREIGIKNNYTGEEIAEYRAFLECAAKWLGYRKAGKTWRKKK